jgi:integrase
MYLLLYIVSLLCESFFMSGKQAKTLSAADVHDLLVYASCTRQPLRNAVIVLLSAKAGLRAGEIAKLTWDMLIDGNGEISSLIELRDHAAKKCSGRSIPVHPDLAAALTAWRQVAPQSQYVIASERGGRMRPLSIVVWFNRAFKNIGLKGCSSHSGRRTFVTRAARVVHKAGGSLRDVQLLAGHRSIQTTQRYIDGDTDAQRKLVAMV